MANEYNIPPDLFLWQIGQESNWNPNAASKTSTAKGLGQFLDSTAKERNVNVNDPYDSIQGAASYMADLKTKTGSWMSALNAYGTTNNNPSAAAQAQSILDSQHAPNTFSLNPDGTVGVAWYDPQKDLGNVQGTGSNPDGTQSLYGDSTQKAAGTAANGSSVGTGLGGASLNIALIVLFFIFGLALIVLAFTQTDTGKQTINAVIKTA